MEITTVGIDLAKSIFQVHAVDAVGHVVVRKALRRAQVVPFFAFKRQPELTPSRHEDLTPMPVSSPRRAWGWGR